jgi:ABC-2 type transport system permease protein
MEHIIPYHLLPWFFFYMIAAIFMFGSLLAAVGSACNDQKEVQSIMPFVMIPMIIPMFVLMPIIKEPLGSFSTALSLIPPFTPVTMMLRQATPTTIPAWQPWVGMAGVALFTLFCVWAGGRIFRIGILLQGTTPKIGLLAKWVFKG